MMDHRHIVMLILAAFVVLELARGRFLFRAQTTVKDIILEIGPGLALSVLIVPLTIWGSAALIERVRPGSADALAHWSPVAMFATLLVVDDLSQYLWHRLSHSWPRLYLLHRAHHSASYLSVRVVYRNNIVYYALMPGLWLSAACLHLGFGPVYLVYYVAKMLVIIAAHSSVAWDAKLLRVSWLRPLMWIVVRTISTPSTHSAHHGKHASDGITHYAGNYGNFLFIWDVLFGTAKISAERPAEYGLENVPPATWLQELIWPVGMSPQPEPDPHQLAELKEPAS